MTFWPKEDYGEFFDGDSYIILNVSRFSSNAQKVMFNKSTVMFNALYEGFMIHDKKKDNFWKNAKKWKTQHLTKNIDFHERR